MPLSRTILTIVLAFVAALGGVVVGCRIMMPPAHQGTELHALLHKNVALDTAQAAQVDVLEARFAVRRAGLEAQLRAANAGLAEAIEAEHANGPRVAAAVDRSHHAMGTLQKTTLDHVFAMRRVMRPDQTATFDRVVMRALTAGS